MSYVRTDERSVRQLYHPPRELVWSPDRLDREAAT